MAPVPRDLELHRPGTSRLLPAVRRSEQGYSLIEIMVALAVLALAVAIVVPGSVELVARYDNLAKRRLAEDAVNNCRLAAIASGNFIALDAPASFRNDEARAGECGILPNGWTATPVAQIVFSPAAVCTGDVVVFGAPGGGTFQYQLNLSNCSLAAAT